MAPCCDKKLVWIKSNFDDTSKTSEFPPNISGKDFLDTYKVISVDSIISALHSSCMFVDKILLKWASGLHQSSTN